MQTPRASPVPAEELEHEFDVQQTHSIERWDRNKLLLQSEGRGWSNLYVAVATVNSWSGTLNPTGHYCIGFCLRGRARLRVSVDADLVPQEATLSPRQFLIIPANESSRWERRGSSEMLMLYLKKELVEAVNKNIFGRLQMWPFVWEPQILCWSNWPWRFWRRYSTLRWRPHQPM